MHAAAGDALGSFALVARIVVGFCRRVNSSWSDGKAVQCSRIPRIQQRGCGTECGAVISRIQCLIEAVDPIL